MSFLLCYLLTDSTLRRAMPLRCACPPSPSGARGLRGLPPWSLRGPSRAQRCGLAHRDAESEVVGTGRWLRRVAGCCSACMPGVGRGETRGKARGKPQGGAASLGDGAGGENEASEGQEGEAPEGGAGGGGGKGAGGARAASSRWRPPRRGAQEREGEGGRRESSRRGCAGSRVPGGARRG